MLTADAVVADTARRERAEHNMVAHLQRRDTRTNVDNMTGSLVSEYRGRHRRMCAIDLADIGVAKAAPMNRYPNLTQADLVELNILDNHQGIRPRFK
jgi:predicted TPR repeat methyltransferase